MKGYPDGTYKPGQFVKNAEAVKMVIESFEKQVENNPQERRYQ